jgi:transketolase
LPPDVKARLSVELASDFGLTKYTGSEGHNISIDSFAVSAPLKQLLKKFGFNAEKVVTAAKSQIAQHRSTK